MSESQECWRGNLQGEPTVFEFEKGIGLSDIYRYTRLSSAHRRGRRRRGVLGEVRIYHECPCSFTPYVHHVRCLSGPRRSAARPVRLVQPIVFLAAWFTSSRSIACVPQPAFLRTLRLTCILRQWTGPSGSPKH